MNKKQISELWQMLNRITDSLEKISPYTKAHSKPKDNDERTKIIKEARVLLAQSKGQS